MYDNIDVDKILTEKSHYLNGKKINVTTQRIIATKIQKIKDKDEKITRLQDLLQKSFDNYSKLDKMFTRLRSTHDI